jgi:hypothetical protein
MSDEKGKDPERKNEQVTPPPIKTEFPPKELFREANERVVEKPQRIIRGNE